MQTGPMGGFSTIKGDYGGASPVHFTVQTCFEFFRKSVVTRFGLEQSKSNRYYNNVYDTKPPQNRQDEIDVVLG